MNVLSISVSGTEYPTILLPPDCIGSSEDRESFLEIGDGHEPMIARCWMTQGQLIAMPTGVRNGSTPVMLNIGANSYNYPIPGTSPANYNVNTNPIFYLLRATPVCGAVATNGVIFEVVFVTEQYGWYYNNPQICYNQLTPDKMALVASTAVSGSQPYSYQQISDNIATSLVTGFGTLPIDTNTAEYPLNVISSNVSPWLGRFYVNAGCHLTATPYGTNSTSSPYFTVTAFNASGTTSESSALNNLANVALYAGSLSTNAVSNYLPANVAQWVSQIKPEPNVTNGEYNIASGTTTGGFDDSATLHIGSHFGGVGTSGGTYSDTNKTYYAYENFSNIAAFRLQALNNRTAIVENTFVFVGAYPICPGSAIRRVRIGMDEEGCFTTVWEHPFVDSGLMAPGGAGGKLGIINYPAGLSAQFGNSVNLNGGLFRYDDRGVLMCDSPTPFLAIAAVSANWVPNTNTISANVAFGTNNVPVTLDLDWPGSFGTNVVAQVFCGLTSNSTVVYFPYPKNFSASNFGLALWPRLPSGTNVYSVLQIGSNSAAVFDFVRATA